MVLRRAIRAAIEEGAPAATTAAFLDLIKRTRSRTANTKPKRPVESTVKNEGLARHWRKVSRIFEPALAAPAGAAWAAAPVLAPRPRSRGRGIGRSQAGAKAGPRHSRDGVGRLAGPGAERGTASRQPAIGWPGRAGARGELPARAALVAEPALASWGNRIRGGGTHGDALGAGRERRRSARRPGRRAPLRPPTAPLFVAISS